MLPIIIFYGLRYGGYQSYPNSGIDDNVRLTSERLATLRDPLSMTRLSSFGSEGPWYGCRGFDALIQTCSRLDVSEADHYEAGEAAKHPTCLVLDQVGG